jgi:hypothetical protein
MRLVPILILVFLVGCTSVSITERKQLIILGDDVIYPQAFKAYENFKNKNKLIKDGIDYGKLY